MGEGAKGTIEEGRSSMPPESPAMDGEEEAARPKPLLFPTIQRSSKIKIKKRRPQLARLFDSINLRHSERRWLAPPCFHAHATCPDFCRRYGTQDSRPEGTRRFDETSPSTSLEKAGREWTAGRAPKDNFQYPLHRIVRPCWFEPRLGIHTSLSRR
jgi:hypothetical protein